MIMMSQKEESYITSTEKLPAGAREPILLLMSLLIKKEKNKTEYTIENLYLYKM